MRAGGKRDKRILLTPQLMERVVIGADAAQDAVPGVTATRGLSRGVSHVVKCTVAAARANGNAEIGKEERG